MVSILQLSQGPRKENRRADDELESLMVDGVAADEDLSRRHGGQSAPRGPPPGFSFSIRRLAYLTLGLLTFSHILLQGQCSHARSKRVSASVPFVTEWKVLTKKKYLTIGKKAKHKGGYLAEVGPDATIKTVGSDFDGYSHVISPALGWTLHNSTHSGHMAYFEKIRDDPDVSTMCPLIYVSIDDPESSSRYMNAPIPLVVGQCCWNATQILHLLLLVAMVYQVSLRDNLSSLDSSRRKLAVRGIMIATICLLPFAAYLISPGAHIWALLTVALSLFAILTPTDKLQLSIGQINVEPTGDPSSRPWLLVREETVCMLCYLGSSLYNSAAGAPVHKWPWFHKWWRGLDSILNLKHGGDVTPDFWFNMGMSSVNIPPFVSRAYTSEMASYVFAGVWAVLPFLYAFNFIIMIVMSNQSPGKLVQRFFATFGLIHFLFWTDVVSYKYGRGYRSDYEDFYHWTEKWSWRIGILIPLFQNCTNGHWGKNAHYFPNAGRFVKYGAMTFGILFFIFQTIQADLIRTYGFLTGGNSGKGLIKIWGLDKKHHIFKKLNYPYFTALVWMWMLYGLLHVLCFRLNRISLRRAADSSRNGRETPARPAAAVAL